MQTIKKGHNLTLAQTAAKIVDININSVKNRLFGAQTSERGSKNRMYNFPIDVLQDYSGKLEKTFRRNMRTNFFKFINEFFFLQKQLEVKSISQIVFAEQIKLMFADFSDFYKQHYVVNDYSFNSVSQGNDGIKKEAILQFLSAAKNNLSNNAAKNNTAAKNNNAAKSEKKALKKAKIVTPVIIPIAE